MKKSFNKTLFSPFSRQNLHRSCYAKSVNAHSIWSGKLQLFKSKWDLVASRELDYAGRAVHIICIYFWGCFKISPHLLQFLRKMPQSCFAVQLQKSSVDDETSPSCSSARGRVDNGWVFISGWTFPLRVCNLFVTPYFNHLIEHGTII